jgi:superfamily II DNA or RNA helicase
LAGRAEILQACRRIACVLEVSEQDLSSFALQIAANDQAECRDAEGEPFDGFRRAQFELAPGTYSLFDYQREVVVLLEGLLADRKKAMLSLPTGAGKTRTALAFCLEQFARTPAIRIDWLAPSHDLVLQAVQTLKTLWSASPLKSRLCYAALDVSNELESGIAFGTLQMAAIRRGSLLNNKSILIIDEAHRVAARTFSRVVRDAERCGAQIVGLTATPGRARDEETLLLSELFNGHMVVPPLLGRDPVRALRERGILATPKFIALNASGRDGSVIKSFVDSVCYSNICPGIAFATSIPECYAVAASLIHRGLRAAVVTHKHSVSVRAARLAALASSQLDWIINVELLSTGIDIPALKAVALLRPIGSPVTYEQIIGRASRGPKIGGSCEAMILDGFDHLNLHGDVSSYSRFLGYEW